MLFKKNDYIVLGAVLIIMGCVYASNDKKKDGVASDTGISTFFAPPPKPKTLTEIIADSVSVAYLMGKFEPSTHNDFVKIDKIYTDKTDAYLRKEAYEAFVKMEAAAAKDGIKLKILSATRNFQRQRKIWEDKWTGVQKIEDGTNAAKKYKQPVERATKILLFSAMPGSSRHHWGTDIDFNYLSDDYFTHGQGKKIYTWLQNNAANFGFCQPYSDKTSGRTGYQEEKWHWTYMPLSSGFTDAARKHLKDEMISGFLGSETATELQIVQKYVLGINTNCYQQ